MSEVRVRWVEHTSKQLKEILAGDPVVILPFGSVEQHGPHVPVGCDTTNAEAVALAAARRLDEPRVLVLPPLWYGFSPHHMEFAGSITLSSETLSDLLVEVGDSAFRQGVRRLVLLNGHAGNAHTMGVAVSRLGSAWRKRAWVVGITYWNLVAHRTAEFRESPVGGMAHACEFETSLQLAIHPDQVDMELAAKSYPEARAPWVVRDLFHGSRVITYEDFADVTPSGVMGDPTLASEEKGKRILDACAEELSRFIVDLAAWPLG